MQHILFLITKGNNIGGAQVYVKELAIQFKRDGYNVTVASGLYGELFEQLKAENVDTILVKNLQVPIHLFRDWKAFLEIKKIIEQVKPDLVCINSSKSGILGRLACKITNTKNVFVVHGWSFTSGIPLLKAIFFKAIEKILKPFSDYWICVSDYDYELGLKAGIIKPNKTIVIKNGIHDKKIFCNRFPQKNDTLTLISIARHDHQKDHATIFSAIKHISSIKVLLIGDGPLFEKNKKLAKELNIEDKLVFLGYKSDVETYLAQADIFILISNWEGFPISTIEAMSAGLPIIVSNVGGAGEAIENFKEGFIIERKDTKTLTEKIIFLQKNKQELLAMGQRSREKYLHKYTFMHMYERSNLFFRNIMQS